MSGVPSASLRELGERLRDEGTPISEHVVEPVGDWESGASEHYEPVIEAVREGYLLHYGKPRLLDGGDADLAVLAGDYLYALGIQRLAASGDCEALLTLADLISACARSHSEGREDEIPALWREAVVGMGDHGRPSQ